MIALNLSRESQHVDIRKALSKLLVDESEIPNFKTCLISTKMDDKTAFDTVSGTLQLRANEGVVLGVKS